LKIAVSVVSWICGSQNHAIVELSQMADCPFQMAFGIDRMSGKWQAANLLFAVGW
jgi:hypothetical protein